jgi:hypothetical protein
VWAYRACYRSLGPSFNPYRLRPVVAHPWLTEPADSPVSHRVLQVSSAAAGVFAAVECPTCSWLELTAAAADTAMHGASLPVPLV